MATPLFSQPTRTGHSSSYVANALVQFKAGRCLRDGTTNWVRPDLRKGFVYITQNVEDDLMHFYWKDRRTQEIEEELIIFQDEAEFVKCSQSEDRVYVLKFLSSNRRLFFWMQSSHPERDVEVCRRVNRVLNSPPAPLDDSHHQHHGMAVSEPAATPDGTDETGVDSTAETFFTPTREGQPDNAELDSDDNASAKATVGSTTTSVVDSLAGTASQAAATGSSSNNRHHDYSETWAQLRQVMENLRVPENTQAGAATQLNLEDVLSSDTLATLLTDPEVCSALFPYLPEPVNASSSQEGKVPATPRRHSPEEVRSIVRSAPFQQSLHSLSYALQTGQLGPLIQQFGLPTEASFGVENFLRAIETQVNTEERRVSSSAGDHGKAKSAGDSMGDQGSNAMEEDS
ncbi:hypothetical protein IWQ61_000959 [Dispira simplex]|nr:hypothetical protein IWQ61_000959 [Dispira simplex]